jgi:hypothetical protein
MPVCFNAPLDFGEFRISQEFFPSRQVERSLRPLIWKLDG